MLGIRRFFTLGVAACGLALFVLPFGIAGAFPQSGDAFDAARLKKAIEDIGYEAKVLNAEVGKEKYEFKLTKDDLDVPVAAEISPSKNYVWLTVYLGPAPKADSPTCLEMLKSNFDVQPSFFYVTTKGNLMMGLAVENRALTNPVLRARIDKIVADVAKTKGLWL
jgi:hypothetical protein